MRPFEGVVTMESSDDALWFVALGFLLIISVLAGSRLRNLPLSTAIFYVVSGVILGPVALDLIDFKPQDRLYLLEKLSEIAVIISLFTAGLKLRLPFTANEWRIAARLASVAMITSIVLIVFAAQFWFAIPWQAALLLAAILAPTDPVLASDVQVSMPGDNDLLRFSLTGEAGLNDGTAFPFVILGLLLLSGPMDSADWLAWFGRDLVWATVGGLATGYLLGFGVGKLILYLRREHQEALGFDNFLALGLIGLSYGLALMLHAYGFLAVFAAGLAVRRLEHRASGVKSPAPEVPQGADEELAVHAEKAPVYLTHTLLNFNEQIERLCELALVLTLGALLRWDYFSWSFVGFSATLFLLIRPLSVAVGTWGLAGIYPLQKKLMAWFGIRGLGSVYYLAYALQRGVDPELANLLIAVVMNLILASIVIHGISVTPLMKRYEKWGRAPH